MAIEIETLSASLYLLPRNATHTAHCTAVMEINYTIIMLFQIENPTLSVGAYLFEEYSCQISSRSSFQRRQLRFFLWWGRPNNSMALHSLYCADVPL